MQAGPHPSGETTGTGAYSPSLLALDLKSDQDAQHQQPPQEAPRILHKMGSLPKLRTPRAPLPPGLSYSLLSPSESPSAAAQPGLRSLLGSPTASATAASSQQGELTAGSTALRQGDSDSQALAPAGVAGVEHSEVRTRALSIVLAPCDWLCCYIPAYTLPCCQANAACSRLTAAGCCLANCTCRLMTAAACCRPCRCSPIWRLLMPWTQLTILSTKPPAGRQASARVQHLVIRHATTHCGICGQHQNASCSHRERKTSGINAGLPKTGGLSCAGPEHARFQLGLPSAQLGS